ncbi:MAG TPA: response regulator [Polyangia bacterium]|nr:response regulator [Polyangia bacterium]
MRRPDRVLVVDDQDIICEVLRTLLRREGFEVATVGDGESALARLQGGAFDVLMVDKNLPGMSGLDVLGRVRTLKLDLEVIIITGYASLDSAIAALRCGAYDYLVKPFSDLMEVAAKVRRAAEKAHLERENLRLSADLRARNQLLEQTLAELRQTQKQAIAAARLAALGEAAGRLGHELQHPLASLTARLQLLRAEMSGHVKAGPALDAALGDTSRVEQVLGEFLDFARPRPPQFAPCELASLVRATLSEFEPQLAERAVRLEAALPAAPLEAEIDAPRVRQVMRNLVRNALEALPQGPGGLIRVEARAAEGSIEILVIDSGAGIAPEALIHIGTPFFTTKPRGTGLGLALSRRIAEEHRGRLEIGNRIGSSGASARLVLPQTRRS